MIYNRGAPWTQRCRVLLQISERRAQLRGPVYPETIQAPRLSSGSDYLLTKVKGTDCREVRDRVGWYRETSLMLGRESALSYPITVNLMHWGALQPR
eukprot:7049866-Pyramimonas_sp.AAC.1